MKRFILYIVICLFAFSAFTQSQEEDSISRFRPGGMWYYTGIKPATSERVRKYDRLIIDITYNDWFSKTQKPFKVNPLSIGFNTNFMFDVPLSRSNTIAFSWGIAYGLYRVDMNDFFVRNSFEKSTELIHNSKQYGIQQSLFKVNSLAIPLAIRFRGKNWKHCKFNVGGKIAYRFRPSTRLSSKSPDGIISQQKTIGFYDFNPIEVSAYFRFGIRNWSLYGSYSFIPLFKNALSTELNTFQFGLSISLF